MKERAWMVSAITMVIVATMYGAAYAIIFGAVWLIDPGFEYTFDPVSLWIGNVAILIVHRKEIFP